MRQIGIQWAKKLVVLSPEFHILLVVALAISLAANLFITTYDSAVSQRFSRLTAAFLLAVAGFQYLPVVRVSTRLWNEARRRYGLDSLQVLKQLVELDSERPALMQVWRGASLFAVFLIGGLVAPGLSDQTLLNGSVAGALYGLLAIGVGLVYLSSRFFYFAFAGFFAAGAYGTYSLVEANTGIGLLAILPITLLAGFVVGGALDASVHWGIQRRNGGSLSLLLASLGIYVLILSCLSMSFGKDARSIHWLSFERIEFIGISMSSLQLWLVLAAMATAAFLELLIRRTSLGRAIRAVGADPELARVYGINVKVIRHTSVGLATAIAMLGGAFAGLDTGLTPDMGFRPLISAVVAVLLVKEFSAVKLFAAGVGLGLLEHLSISILPSALQGSVVYVFLLLVLFAGAIEGQSKDTRGKE